MGEIDSTEPLNLNIHEFWAEARSLVRLISLAMPTLNVCHKLIRGSAYISSYQMLV